MKVLDSDDSRYIEQCSVSHGISLLRLMNNAGKVVSNFIKENLLKSVEKDKNIVILCGKGNNGGDGFVIADDLSNEFKNICIILVDGEPKTNDAKIMLEKIRNNKNERINIYNCNEDDSINLIVEEAGLIVDAIYGIGFKGNVSEKLGKIIDCVNASEAKVVSVDIPSGLYCNTGNISSNFIRADYTITFTTLKLAHVLYPSSDYCGKIILRSVGIPDCIVDNCKGCMDVIDASLIKRSLPKFIDSANKKDRGRLFSLCSSIGMPGACIMSAKAALRTGVGLLDLAVLKDNYSIVASQLPESIFTILNSDDNRTYSYSQSEIILNSLSKSTACLIGCGLGISDDLKKLVYKIIKECNFPMVIDADGINILSQNIDILKEKESGIVLTPHPGEMARLLGATSEDIQKDRYNIAREFSIKYNVVLVLKGAKTLVSLPNGSVYVNLTGNNGLAKGGSGDILSGMIASFLAQGMEESKAALCAVYLHGLAGDICAEKYSKTYMLPTDILTELYKIFTKFER